MRFAFSRLILAELAGLAFLLLTFWLLLRGHDAEARALPLTTPAAALTTTEAEATSADLLPEAAQLTAPGGWGTPHRQITRNHAFWNLRARLHGDQPRRGLLGLLHLRTNHELTEKQRAAYRRSDNAPYRRAHRTRTGFGLAVAKCLGR